MGAVAAIGRDSDPAVIRRHESRLSECPLQTGGSPTWTERLVVLPRSDSGVCVIIATAIVLLYSIGGPARARDDGITEILSKEGVEYAYPHFSKGGASILFQSNESGRWRLCTIPVDGGRPVALTPDSVNCYFPDWSPDNEKICYVSDRTGNEEIYIMDAGGSNERPLTANGARNIHPYWSPDGQTILFSSDLDGGGDLDVYRIRPDGTGLEALVESADHETCARMSPDGNSITLLKNNDAGLDDLFLVQLKDGSAVNLTCTPTLDGWPCWTPDGSKIVFSAAENDVFKLFVFDLESGTSDRLTNPVLPFDDCRANVSPNGRFVVFNRQHDSPDGRTNEILMTPL